MTRAPASIALIITALAVLSTGVSAAEDTTRAALEQLEHDFNDAILNRDGAALDRLLADDYTFEGNTTFNKPEHIDRIVSVVPPKTQTIDSMSVKLYGDSAVVTGLATSERLSPAGASTQTFRWVNVWVHGEHGWQVVYSQTNVTGFGPDGC